MEKRGVSHNTPWYSQPMIFPDLQELKRSALRFIENERISWRTLFEPQKVFLLLARYGYLKFLLTGGTGVLINLGLTWFFTEYVYGLENYFDAYLIGISANLLWNFMLYSLWLFKTKHRHFLRFVVFVTYALIMTWVNAVIVSTVTPIIGLQYYLIVIAATIFLLSTFNFFVFKMSLFREPVDAGAWSPIR